MTLQGSLVNTRALKSTPQVKATRNTLLSRASNSVVEVQEPSTNNMASYNKYTLHPLRVGGSTREAPEIVCCEASLKLSKQRLGNKKKKWVSQLFQWCSEHRCQPTNLWNVMGGVSFEIQGKK